MLPLVAQDLPLPCFALPCRVNVMRTHYDRLSAVVNRLSERPLIADQWLILADNWLLTADVLSLTLAKQCQPLNNPEQTT